MKPKRIQRKRTNGWKMPEGAVYVGRPTRWGNPFKVGTKIRRIGGNREIVEINDNAVAVDMFHSSAMDFATGYLFRQTVQAELRGKDLACWCPLDKPCHADVLLEIANAEASA